MFPAYPLGKGGWLLRFARTFPEMILWLLNFTALPLGASRSKLYKQYSPLSLLESVYFSLCGKAKHQAWNPWEAMRGYPGICKGSNKPNQSLNCSINHQPCLSLKCDVSRVLAVLWICGGTDEEISLRWGWCSLRHRRNDSGYHLPSSSNSFKAVPSLLFHNTVY